MWQILLKWQFYGNTGRGYLTAILVFIGTLIILKIIRSLVITRLKKIAKKTKTDVDDVIIDIVSQIKPPFYSLLALYLGIKTLVLPNTLDQIVRILFIAVLVYETINALQKVIEYIAQRALKKGENDKEAEATVKILSIITKIVLWSLGVILILGNLGINVTSLVAGLGIGGVAVALALQNILGDVFSSFSILIDKPFQVGDLIKIGTDIGTVERIGIKTTRLRTLEGQQLIIANQELTSARVQNFRQLEKRRALFSIGVTYETSKSKLKQIPKLIKEIIEKEKLAEFDRCHFKDFGDFSLNFEIVFYVKTKDYKKYRDVIQRINLAIFDEFNQNKIAFAYPTSVEYQKKLREEE